MPSTFIRSDEALNAEADAVCALLNGGYLRLYTGPQPSHPRDPADPQALICELRFGSPAFAAAQEGRATAHPLTACPAAVATGAPTWFRAVGTNGTRGFDGSVGFAIDTPDLVIDPALVQIGARVVIGPVTYRASAA